MSHSHKERSTEPTFSVGRSLKLGTFHIGSSLADLLTSAVWNRIMITDLGVAAWPVALLAALRYFMAPLSLWAGHRSDTRPILGSHRIAYIWLGRALMLLSLPLIPIATVRIAQDTGSILGWSTAIVSFVFYGLGTLASGAPFLALVHDSAPYERRGQAVSLVQIILVVSFAFIPALYAALMPNYDAQLFQRMTLFGIGGAAIFWFVSVWGEERPGTTSTHQAESPSFRDVFGAVWSDRRTRRYAAFLGASAFFAFMQDAVLEPFGGDVFGLNAGDTTRFNAYWGAGVLVGMTGTIVITRHRRPDQQITTTALGLALLGIPVLFLSLSSLLEALQWVTPILIAFGLGFGVFTVGGVSLLMAMSTEEQAGSYLALWSVVQLVARGLGIAAGGILRDGALALTREFSTAYAGVFAVEALGILGCIALLHRVDVRDFSAQRKPATASETIAASAE